jgi:DnaJ-class molecular chaperone
LNHYTTLGISPDATPDEVRQAYVRHAKIYHPDKNSSPDATVKMAEVNLAYEILCDSQKRKDYDIDISVVTTDAEDEDGKTGQESPERSPGRCAECNFVNDSGMFVCSVCGYVFDPEPKNKRRNDYYDSDEIIGHEELRDLEDDALSEIIRCPQCNEINRYGHGSCWQCGLDFEIEQAL